MRVFGDRYKGSMEENDTYSVLSVLWSYSWRSGGGSDGSGIGMADGGDGDRLCVWIEMWK